VNPIITVDICPHLSMAPKCIYKSPPKMSSQTATSVEVMDQTNRNRKPQFIETVDNISFRMLVPISEAWKDKGMIKSWETGNNIPYTCIKFQLNCKECGFEVLVIDFDEKYENLRVAKNTWFNCTFIDPFSKLLYHTHHCTTQSVAMFNSYPNYIKMMYPFESWH
jgi:hypothetical protein